MISAMGKADSSGACRVGRGCEARGRCHGRVRRTVVGPAAADKTAGLEAFDCGRGGKTVGPSQ